MAQSASISSRIFRATRAQMVQALRYDRALTDLIRLLSTRTEEFRVLWAGHDVRFHRSGTKRFHHPLVGELTLAYESLDLPADAGLTIVTYSAEPGSNSEAALGDLERWSATRAKLALVGIDAPL
jgi:hypothetical protein